MVVRVDEAGFLGARRRERIAAGEIVEGKNFTMLNPVRQGVTVEGYQLGDTVLFSGERDKNGKVVSWEARLQTEEKVVALDRERNVVRVGYSFSIGDLERREVGACVGDVVDLLS